MTNTKIVKAKIWDVDLKKEFPGHNLIFIELITDTGIIGLGEIAMVYGYGAKANIPLCKEIIEGFVIGADPLNTRAIWDNIEGKTYWAQGRNLMHRGVQAAIDIALWDIKGQILNQPVYNLLGGKVRDGVELYANHWYGDVSKPKEYAEKAKRVVNDGYKGLKFDPFRMSPEGKYTNPPKPLPDAWGRLAIERVKAVRESVGDLRIFIDAHASLTLFDAVKWGKKLEEFDISFFEEPVVSYNPEETLEIKSRLNMPLAGGERLYSKQDFFNFIKSRTFDIVQPDICLAGGFTGLQEIAIIANAREVLIQPHNCAGPICSAASVQFDMATPNLLIQEWFPYWEDNRYKYVNGSYELIAKNGVITPPEKPGLGISLNYDEMSRFSFVSVE